MSWTSVSYAGMASKEQKTNILRAALKPVNLKFDEITEVKQHTGAQHATFGQGAPPGSYTLSPRLFDFTPSGVVPDYALMEYELCWRRAS